METGAERKSTRKAKETARKGDVRAIQLIAERTQGKLMRAVEISGSDGGALEIDYMTDEQLDQRINELLTELNNEVK